MKKNEALKEIDGDGDKKVDVFEFMNAVVSWQNAAVMTVDEAITELNLILDDLNWMKLKTDGNPSNFQRVASTKPRSTINTTTTQNN